MKLFLVISDTHGDLYKAKEVITNYPQINGLIHLGDYYKDAVILQNQFPHLECIMVPGNCDFVSNVPMERVLEIEEKKIFLTHGNYYNVKSGTERLESKALKEGFDALLFGHTHIPLLKSTPTMLLLNPGCLGYSRGISGSTYALLEISKRNIEARILDA